MVHRRLTRYAQLLAPIGSLFFGMSAAAQDWANQPIPADPGPGKEWAVDWTLSDDFNYDSNTSGGQAQFSSKWQDWKPNFFLGPGATYFSPNNWFVDNGAMTIFGSRVPPQQQIVNTSEPEFMRTTYTSYITSKAKLQPGSYTEILMKGGGTPLSANFWMIDDTDTTEIDVLEIYGDTDSFRRNPRTNVHFQIRENGQVVADVSNQLFHPKDNINYSQSWHRYGVHWIDETNLDFYYDGELVRSLYLPDEIVDPRGLYLNESVRLIMNLEAHSWRGDDGIPSDAELNDWSINNMQVDWVRTYRANALPQNGVVFADDFSAPTLGPVWNSGGGFYHNTINENVTLSTFGSSWGAKGDNSGAAGLNSTVGYASFTVSDDGVNPIGGHFQIGKDVFDHSANAVARFSLAIEGAGAYELVWNNSGVAEDFAMASGWSGTIDGNSFVWIVDGDSQNPHWGQTDAAANVSVGDAANRFGFWHTSAASTAVIDDFLIWNSLSPSPVGLDGDYNADGTVDAADYVAWRKNPSAFGGDQGYDTWQANFGIAESESNPALASAVPEPGAALVLAIAVAIVCATIRERAL